MSENTVTICAKLHMNPRVWIMAESLGIDPDAVVGKLIRLWVAIRDSDATIPADPEFKLAVDQQLGAIGFVDAAIWARMLEDCDDCLALPCFEELQWVIAFGRLMLE